MFFLLYGETIQQKQKVGIVTSLNDKQSQRWHTENMPLASRMKWCMESTSGLVPSETLSSI